MAYVQRVDKLVSVMPRKKLGRPNGYGRNMFGYSRYGEEDIVLFTEWGMPVVLSGIYQRNYFVEPDLITRMPYYIPRNPRTVPQQAQRAKMTSAVAAWLLLTPEQKAEYNERAVGLHMSGYNLYLREYISSA